MWESSCISYAAVPKVTHRRHDAPTGFPRLTPPPRASENGGDPLLLPGVAAPLHSPSLKVYEGFPRLWLTEQEYTCTAEDILWRRTKPGLHMGGAEREALEDHDTDTMAMRSVVKAIRLRDVCTMRCPGALPRKVRFSPPS